MIPHNMITSFHYISNGFAAIDSSAMSTNYALLFQPVFTGPESRIETPKLDGLGSQL